MGRFTQGDTLAALEIQQLVADWGHALDIHGGDTVAELCTEDCDYLVGGKTFKGHAPVRAFYAARNVRVAEQQRDGVRTQRHTITNHRYVFADADHASVEFTLVNYSAEGRAPALNLVGPTIIADCRMNFRRGDDGVWRIALFDSEPVFIGNDPFLNAAVVKQ